MKRILIVGSGETANRLAKEIAEQVDVTPKIVTELPDDVSDVSVIIDPSKGEVIEPLEFELGPHPTPHDDFPRKFKAPKEYRPKRDRRNLR
jgi:hypothetical protein